MRTFAQKPVSSSLARPYPATPGWVQRAPRQKLARFETDRIGASGLEQTEVPSIVYEVLDSPGQSLDPVTRGVMAPRFGHDFSQVRVHTDAKAASAAQAVNARAFTVGRDVVFGAGQQTFTAEGRRLIAHELAHVVQQNGRAWQQARTSAQRLVIQRQPDSQDNGSSAKGGTTSPADWAAVVYTKIVADAEPLPPELRGRPKAYFLITYEPSEFERMFLTKVPGAPISEKESIQDEMEYLKDAGYVVVYIEFATERDVISAFQDPDAALVFSTGHGEPPGVIRTTNEDDVAPGDLKIPAGSDLQEVILEHCNIGDQAEKWKQALPKYSELVAWTGKTTVRESVQYNTTGGSGDRQWGNLMTRVKALPQLENQQGEIYRVTEKGEIEIGKSAATGLPLPPPPPEFEP